MSSFYIALIFHSSDAQETKQAQWSSSKINRLNIEVNNSNGYLFIIRMKLDIFNILK